MRKLLRKLPVISLVGLGLNLGFSPLYAAEKVEVYFNHLQGKSYTDPYRNIHRPGQNLEEVLVDYILSAKKSVNVAVQELRLPLVAKALAQQHAAGVKVRVVLENSYNNTLLTATDPDGDEINQHEASRFVELFALVDKNDDKVITVAEMDDRDAVHILRKASVPVKDDTFDGSMGSSLMHHKFVVIDDEKVVVSTANFTISGTHGDFLVKDSVGNANSMIKIESKKVAQIFNTEFFQMWGGRKGMARSRFGVSKSYRGTQKTQVDGTSIEVQFSPTSKLLDWERSVNGLIGKTLAEAKDSVMMALFVLSDQKIAEVLRKRVKKTSRFDLRVLVEPKFAYRNYSETLDMWGIALLDENCAYEEDNKVWSVPQARVGAPDMTPGDLLHHKFAVVDEETVIVGSQNWSANANFQNDENVIVIRDPKIASAFKREYLRLEKNARLGASISLLKRIERMEKICSGIIK